MPKDKSTGKKLADMLYGNPERAAFGVFPQLGRRGQAKPAPKQAEKPFIDERAMELPQFGDLDLDVPTAANRAMGQRMVERDVDLKRQADRDMSPLEKLAGGIQAGRLIGSGLTQAVKSIPTAISKGSKAAEDYIAENIYQPTQPKAYEYAGNIADFLTSLESDYKIPPIIPEAMVFQNLVGPATRQAGKAVKQGAKQGALNLAAPRTLNPQAGVIKTKGGNFLTGSVEGALKPLKRSGGLTPQDVVETEAHLEKIRPSYDLNNPKDARQLREMEDHVRALKSNLALDNWVDRNLGNYVKKEMATPEDPVRRLAEEGITHMPQNEIDYHTQWIPEDLALSRMRAGFPSEGLGQSNTAKGWEAITDSYIHSAPASKYTEPLTESEVRRGLKSVVDDNPWLSKLDPDTQVQYLKNADSITQDLRLDHIMDVLREDLTSGRIRPEQLSKVSMEQAVRRTAEYDQELAAKMNAARNAQREGLPVYKEYPEGYRWVELNKPGAFASESEAMGHSVRGYEPPQGHPDWVAGSGDRGSLGYGHGGWEAIKSGKAKVYSLVGPKGEPHVTVEVAATGMTPEQRQYKIGFLADQLQKEGKTAEEALRQAEKIYPEERKEAITQIKGKQNQAPNQEYLPFVQDFVKSGQWSDVGDLQNTGLYSAKDVINFMPENFTMSRNARQLAIGRARQAKDMPDYMTKPEYEAMLLKHAPEDIWAAEKAKLATDDDELLRQLRPPEGMARGGPVSLDQLAARYEKGGVVGDSATVYDPLQVDAIIESMITPTNYADDGEVDADAGLTNWLRTVAAKAMSLDTPEMTLGETAADIAAGFVPGVGTAMSARDFERARREDDYLGMALSGAGMIPLVGGMARGVNKARKGENTLEGLFEAYSATDRANAGRKAAELIKSQEQVNASEALGQLMEEGFKKTSTTQADRTRVGGGNIGGAAFSAISEADPAYAGKVWGVMDEGTASRLTNLTTPDTAWTTMLGSSTQLKTNPIVFDKLKRGFLDSMKQGNLTPELAAKINHNLALTFGEGADIRDPKIWREANTFEKRAALADVMMGQGVAPGKGGVALGGEKSGKGVIFKPTDILIKETERGLLHPEHGGDVATFAAGPRMFSLDKTTEYRPDLHPGFPTLIGGRDLRVNVKPTPTEVYLPDWHRDFKAANPSRKGPGYYDLALGVKGQGLPSQALNDEYIRHLIREGYADGGMVGDPVAAYDPLQIDNVMQSMDEPRNYADGGSVSEYDSDRIDAIVNEIM